MKKLTIFICRRGLSVNKGSNSLLVASLLEEMGDQIVHVNDGTLNLDTVDILLIFGNANWFPIVLSQLLNVPNSERPLVVIWHSEPLPPPRVACVQWPIPNLRETFRILRRDKNATDVYTNYFRLRHLIQKGLPDLLVVSTPGRREFLKERGISAHWIPLGYHLSHGHDMRLSRDEDVIFLGTLEPTRRKRMLKRLRRNGVKLCTKGNWFDPSCWDENRTRLLNRTKIFLNILRFPSGFCCHVVNNKRVHRLFRWFSPFAHQLEE